VSHLFCGVARLSLTRLSSLPLPRCHRREQGIPRASKWSRRQEQQLAGGRGPLRLWELAAGLGTWLFRPGGTRPLHPVPQMRRALRGPEPRPPGELSPAIRQLPNLLDVAVCGCLTSSASPFAAAQRWLPRPCDSPRRPSSSSAPICHRSALYLECQ
jgi:hypothetical protein